MNRIVKKIIKWTIVSITASVLFIVVGAFIFTKIADQDKIRSRLTEFLSHSTSRNVDISGGLQFKLFPSIAIHAANISIDNPPGFRARHFVEAEEVVFRIKVLPLFLGKISIGRVFIKNLNLLLIRDSSGHVSWQNLPKENQVRNNSEEDLSDDEADDPIKLLIEDFTVENGKIVFVDKKNNNKLILSGLDLNCKGFNFKKPFNVKSSFYLSDKVRQLGGKFRLSSSITLDPGEDLYKIENLHLFGELKNTTMSRPVMVKGKMVGGDLDLDSGILRLNDIFVNLAGVVVKGSFIASGFYDNLNFQGQLAVGANDASEIIQLFFNEQYLHHPLKARFNVIATADDQVINLTTIDATCQNTSLKGQGQYSHGEFRFNLDLDKIDLDKIINMEALGKNSSKSSSRINAIVEDVDDVNNNVNGKVGVGHSVFRDLKLNGSVKIKAIKAGKLEINDVGARLLAKYNLIECSDGVFKLHDGVGHYDARIELDKTLPKVRLNLSIKDLALRPLLASIAQYDRLGGLFNLNVELFIQRAMHKPFDSINGSGNLTITDGAYYGIDVPYEVRRVHALLNDQPIPAKINPQLTTFNRLGMDFKIVGGLLNTDNFIVNAKDYEISGNGNANLSSQLLDFSLQAHSNNDKSFFIPIKITDSFRAPSIKLDAAIALQRVVKDTLQNVVKDQLKKHKIPSGLENILRANKVLY